MEILTTPIADKVKAAHEVLNAHVRDMVAWHFDPNTGCPFWLDFARGLGFDPRREIGGYGDLKLLGHFQDEWLRGGARAPMDSQGERGRAHVRL